MKQSTHIYNPMGAPNDPLNVGEIVAEKGGRSLKLQLTRSSLKRAQGKLSKMYALGRAHLQMRASPLPRRVHDKALARTWARSGMCVQWMCTPEMRAPEMRAPETRAPVML